MIKHVQDADLHLLRVFVSVVECGGLTAAQDRLNVASSTISTQISNLETRLGFRLCKRGRGGFNLTPEGSVVLEAAYRLFGGLGEFVETVDSLRGQSSGTLRLVLLDSSIGNPAFRLAETLAEARTEMPFVHFEVMQMLPGALESTINSGNADIGIGFVNGAPPGLDCHDLFFERQVLCCGAGHPLFDMPSTSIDRQLLKSYDWVKDSYRLPADYPFANPQISTATAAQIEGVMHFLLAGTHLGFLPQHVAGAWITAGLLRSLIPESCYYDLPFKVITRKDRVDEKLIAPFRRILISTHLPGQIGNPIA